MGELIAIDRVEVAAGALVVFGMGGVVLAAMNSLHTRSGLRRAGRVLIASSLAATGIYTVGLVCVASGWMTASLFPHRFVENLVGSVLSAVLGYGVTRLPRLLDRIHSRPHRLD